MRLASMSLALFAAVCLSARAAAYDVGDTVNLVLPDGQPSFSLSIVAAPPPGIAGPSFIARDLGGEASATLKQTPDGLRATIDDFGRGKVYSVRVRNGVVTYSVRDAADCGVDVCGTCGGDIGVPPEAPSAASATVKRAKTALRSTGEFPIADQKKVIDILVAFDRGAKAWAESAAWPDGDTVEEFAGDAVDKMNMVLEKSQVLDAFCYRLVGVVEVDATYDVINQSLLGELRLRSSGPLAAVAAAREKCGADTITLLVDRDASQSTTSGIGYEYLTQWTFAAFDAIGYTCNICDVKTVYSRYTMCHETGHNMGCGHSDRQGSVSGPGCFPYSCGYHFVDAAGTKRYTVMGYSYTSPASGEYLPVPYFSSPDITPAELGVVVGTPTNDNRQTILRNCEGASTWREHVVPYDWDVRFLDDNGNDIPDGTYFANTLYVTLTNSNPDATIYYTYDVSTPGPGSYSCRNGQRFTLYESKTITACAVTNGVAMSVRTVTFNEGHSWSGEPGQNGSGVWTDDDPSVLSWNDSTAYFYSYLDSVVFPDLAQGAAPTVTVRGAVVPAGAAFTATKTAYTFEKGSADAMIHLRDASFAPSGDLTFNVPVQLDAVAFTNPASHTVSFNAPFGQTVTETSGYCTNMIGIGAHGTLVVAPGAGKTQTFDHFSNVSWFYNNATIRVGEGTVVFKGPSGSKGLFGSTQMNIAREGRVVLDMSSAPSDPFYTSAVSGEGTVEYRAVLTSDSSRWASSSWKGTVAFDGLAADSTTQNFQFENYGNADSRILLRNCAISYLKDNNATFPGTLVLDGAGAFSCGNGYSGKYNVFGALEGDGSMSFSGSPTHGYVFNVATNYTGSITVNASGGTGRRIVFGSASASGDIPSQTATITVKTGATASIGGGATWSAYHGVEVAGTLLVKGAGATLDCNASAAMGLKLDDGATLSFDAVDAKLTFTKAPQFASGTVNIAFANGATPYDGMVLVEWPNGAAPAGDFALADPALASRWVLTKAATVLVVAKAPLPAMVNAAITVRYWGDDGWEDRVLDFDLPTEWITNYYPTLDTVEAVAAKYDEDAANGAKVWQCYMLGLDPTDASSSVSLAMTVDGNEIRFAVEGLGETHELDGIQVQWRMKTSTNLVADAAFSNVREYKTGLPPKFSTHSMPDKPTGEASESTVDTLFYKISVSFVAEDEDIDD